MLEFRKKILEIITTPIRAIRLHYIPMLFIYFAYGASAFIGIAEFFWIKEELQLPLSDLQILNIWLLVPWTSKMIFGQLVDSVKIFGSNRKVYALIGAGLMIVATVLLIILALEEIVPSDYKIKLYFLSSILYMLGLVIQDVVADTMSTEVVDRNQTQEKIKQELTMVQILARLSLGLGFLIMPPLGGYLFNGENYVEIFTLSLFVPIVSVVGIVVIDIDEVESSPLDKKIIWGGLLFALFSFFIGYYHLNNPAFPSQEMVFILSLGVVLYFLNIIIKDLDKQSIQNIKKMMIIIFVYQAIPNPDTAVQWWQTDILGLKREFFTDLSLIGGVLGFLGLWLSAKYIVEQSISKVLLWLVIISTLLSLPNLLLYYIHDTLDIDVIKSVVYMTTTLISPFKYFAMVLILTLIAIHAPKGKRGTWFALMTSLVNIAVSTGELFNKYLFTVLEISKEAKKYTHLDIFLWIVMIVGFILPIVTILIVDPKMKKNLKDTYSKS